MDKCILVIIFWFSGFLAIAISTFVFSRSIKAETTRELQTIRNIAIWGAVMATLWLVFGGAFTFDQIRIYLK